MRSQIPASVTNLIRLLCLGILMLPATGAALLPFKNTGNLYVSMWASDEIAVFSPEGESLERFTAEGLDGPRGIAFNPANGEIWVASEISDAIFIFDHAHRFLRRLEHPDFNEPVGVTFTAVPGIAAADQTVYISNSNGNELMVFDQAGNLQRRFTGTALQDPNCSAFMADGGLFVSNRLGGSTGNPGAVSAFNNDDVFQFDFTTSGIASLMAVARDPNSPSNAADDSLWVTSGSGDTGIYEFDPNGNLLTSLLPADIGDGRALVPQGIAFDGDGNFYVVSYLNEVVKFDSDGNFLLRFPTGAGTARSTAFQGCQEILDSRCVPFGADEDSLADASVAANAGSGNGGGGSVGWLVLLGLMIARRWRCPGVVNGRG